MTGLMRVMMGSNTAKVIGHAHCSVLIVPTDAQIESKKIMVAVDGSHYSDKAAEILKRVTPFMVREGIAVKEKILSGKADEAIIEIAKAKGVDLIVVGSHGRTGLDRLMMGSVSDRVISYAECAILVVKAYVKWHKLNFYVG